MAVRRGVWLVVALLSVAVIVSAAGLIFTAMLVGRAPQIGGNSVLMMRVSGDLAEVEPGQHDRVRGVSTGHRHARTVAPGGFGRPGATSPVIQLPARYSQGDSLAKLGAPAMARYSQGD